MMKVKGKVTRVRLYDDNFPANPSSDYFIVLSVKLDEINGKDPRQHPSTFGINPIIKVAISSRRSFIIWVPGDLFSENISFFRNGVYVLSDPPKQKVFRVESKTKLNLYD